MQIRINTNDGTPIYQQIVSQVKYLIASGRLVTGEQLPPVRKLAEQLTVNPNTVARAYRELESEKLIAPRRGSGVFVEATDSPFADSEKLRILTERIDSLVSEATLFDISLDQLLELIADRFRKIADQNESKKQ